MSVLAQWLQHTYDREVAPARGALPAGALARAERERPDLYARIFALQNEIDGLWREIEAGEGPPGAAALSRFQALCRELAAALREAASPSGSPPPRNGPESVSVGGNGSPPMPPGPGRPNGLAAAGSVSPAAALSPEVVRVSSAAGLREAVAAAAAAGVCGLDAETFGPGREGGLDPHLGGIRLVQIAVPDGEGGARVYVADMAGAGDFSPLWDLLADDRVLKVLHNAKFDLKFLRKHLDRRLPPVRLFDTMLASQLLACGRDVGSHSLEACCERFLSASLDKSLQTSDFSRELTDDQMLYAARDAAVLLPLAAAQVRALVAEGLQRAARLEFECAPAVADMEWAGLPFDLAYWNELAEGEEGAARAAREVLLAELAPVLDRDLFGGTEFNPDSPAQVLPALRALGLDVPDTRDDTLRFRYPDHPAVRALLEYRRHAKRVSAFLRPYAERVHPVTGRIHAEFVQINRNGVGRMSARNPNVQQFPREEAVRRAFAVPDGRVLVVADYSQIELRGVAWYSRDPRMLEAYRSGEDLHRLTAALINGIPPERVSKEMRQAAKAVNFGFCYGMSARTFQIYAKTNYGVELTLEQSGAFRGAYFRVYPGVTEWHRRQKAEAGARGYVRTVSGRKRVLPPGFSPTLAYNTPVQGSCADVLKLAMSRFYGELFRRGWEDTCLVNSVHDELLVECPEGAAAEVAVLLKEQMEGAWYDLMGDLVPVTAEPSAVRSWADKS